MCIRDRYQRRVRGVKDTSMAAGLVLSIEDICHDLEALEKGAIDPQVLAAIATDPNQPDPDPLRFEQQIIATEEGPLDRGACEAFLHLSRSLEDSSGQLGQLQEQLQELERSLESDRSDTEETLRNMDGCA
eukprot:TRINITY_DN7348_c0_g1_i10.p1 TRINITY_DN7348_c0_g1~~TRINITY_DN7348_c0_g1_i10.p1  ORF type:complete len:131 (-),score=44.80 TRINITY_DN7348_c0_g1_i10:596-988(-)